VVADLSTVWANLSVYQRDLDRIRAGEIVRFHADDRTLIAEGKITYVTPVVEESTRTATARVVLDNADGRWRPGMFVIGVVEVSRREVGVAVPRSALFTLHGETVVFIQDEHGFEARPVHGGATDNKMAEILEGLEAGEQFVSAGGFTLKAELEKGSFGDGHAH
jgi:cobalt-zinc-cadmium efflux system membrane fusion protein